jgi:superfamily II DNA or RNA helicase
MISEYIPREGDWKNQNRAVTESVDWMNSGKKLFCVTSPTGSGKTRITQRWCEHFVGDSLKVGVLSNRRLLTNQLLMSLAAAGIDIGCRAAEFESWTNPSAPVQIISPQTEHARVVKKRLSELRDIELPRVDVLIVDECHLQKGSRTVEMIREYRERYDATIIGLSATPMGIGQIYTDGLIVAANNSQMRECGALVWANRFEPWVMDLKKVYKEKTGTVSQKGAEDEAKEIWTQHIVAGVFESWKKFNPDARPSLGMAPGVKESRWLVRNYWGRGVNAAHIDGEGFMVDGKEYTSTDQKDRDELLERVRIGEIPQIWNRFVLREGIDIPEFHFLQLATPIMDFKAYIQVCGRVLRAHPSKTIARIVDHAGCIQLHGNPNDDHDEDWKKYFFKGEDDYSNEQYEAKRDPNGNVQQQITCPECGAMRDKGPKCLNPKCGFEHEKSVRFIKEESGELRRSTGDAIKKKSPPIMKSDTEKNWEGFYWRFRKSGKTFSQAIGAFAGKFKYRPPTSLPGMPFDIANMKRKIAEVPFAECVPLKFKPKPPKEESEPVPERTLFE